ncbi:MAG: box helicase, partial [Mycobacterium sp.]|nr:box helicase [Mycobacterium sp.]
MSARGAGAAGPTPAEDPLGRFGPATQAWFRSAFPAPTAAQEGAWEAISGGRDALVVAPTGSGKTLAAFLWSIDRLAETGPPEDPARRCRVLYISPMKALAFDVERNLRAPLVGVDQARRRLGLPAADVTVAVRSGDTPAQERRQFARRPSDILITTPESLFLLLTSAARESLRGVEWVIIDEVHAVAGTKRGAHLAISLERLDALLDRPAQRIGLSATVRPLDEVARFLSTRRAVDVVAPAVEKTFDLQVVVPVPDMGALDTGGTDDGRPGGGSAAGAVARASIWPAVEERVVDLIAAHRSTIVFANSRRLAERLCSKLNEIAARRMAEAEHPDGLPPGAPPPALPAQLMAQAGSGLPADATVEIARAHHGSVSREQRTLIEEELKAGRLPAVVATSSLELGIDMGAVDLVVQVESPPSVASGLQRVGRAGHQVGAVSRGVLFPKYRGDLVQAAVVCERMRDGAIEALRYPRNPLDVLAQQIVAMVAMEPWTVGDLAALVRRAAPYAELPDSALTATLDMLAGRYPSDEFAELRPRLVWDRDTDLLTGRPGAQRLAVTSGGTIPDRGTFGVFLVGEKSSRVGELDEEMVYESRVGDVFLLGSSSWRIEDITPDRVLVTPAPGQPGKMPFWHGDAAGRPLELGRAIGAFLRESAGDEQLARERCAAGGLDAWATDNLLGYLAEQRAATGVLPDDRTIVVERFRDELGDWRLVVHCPFGAQVNAPWALAITARLRATLGIDAAAMHSDDGIVLRLPDTDVPPDTAAVLFDPEEIEDLVRDEVGGSALFASRFRECAARALLLPRRNPGRRTPLWQQRQRSAQLLAVASRFGSFPVVLETLRECLQDVFDLPGLVSVLQQLRDREVRVVEVETVVPSPFARSLLFGYVAQFLYEGDAPLAERRAAALSLDPTMLAELLGRTELQELLDPADMATLEAELQLLVPDRQPRTVEQAADALRRLGDLTTVEAEQRGISPAWLAELGAARRILDVRLAGEPRWVPVEDAGRLQDALGLPLPVGVPSAFTEPVPDPLGDLVSRYARTHGPFTAADVARRLGLGTAVVDAVLSRLVAVQRVVAGDFRATVIDAEYCDAEVLRRLRRRALARYREQVEPVPAEAVASFLPTWQHLGTQRVRGVDGLYEVLEQLAGVPLPAGAWESLVLPARVRDYAPALLDELTASGEVTWCGAGALPGADGWVAFAPADLAATVLPPPEPPPAGPLHAALLAELDGGAALFFRSLADRLAPTDEAGLAAALWELVWAGHIGNDTFAPVRSLLAHSPRTSRAARAPSPRTRSGRRIRPALGRARPAGA